MGTTISTMAQDGAKVYLPPRRGDEPPWFVGRIQQKVKDYVNAPTATQAEKEIAKLRRECSIYEGIRDRSAAVKDAVGTLYKAKEYFKATENRAANIKVDSRLEQLQKDLQILQSTNPDIKQAEDEYLVAQYAIPAMVAQKSESPPREAILPERSSIPAPLPAARERNLRPAKLLMQVREKNLSLAKMSTPAFSRPPTDQEIIKAEGLENAPFEAQAQSKKDEVAEKNHLFSKIEKTIQHHAMEVFQTTQKHIRKTEQTISEQIMKSEDKQKQVKASDADHLISFIFKKVDSLFEDITGQLAFIAKQSDMDGRQSTHEALRKELGGAFISG